MIFKNENNILTLEIEGDINATNSAQIESQIYQIIDKNSFETIILDFKNVSYISSMGLRIVQKLRHHYPSLKIINVSLEVYDIFEMTGFTKIVDISKALKEVSVEGCQLIGQGYFSDVYRLDKDTIIKIFKRTSDIKEVQRELSLAKEAFILGIPTAISFDIVKVGDLYGARFEMLNTVSLRDEIVNNPEKFDTILDQYKTLISTINHTESMSDSLPDMKKIFLSKLEYVKQFIEKDKYEKMKKMILEIPESKTFIHGDCHVKNILLQNGEFCLIDMDTLSVGAPIFELALICAPYLLFEEAHPGNSLEFFKLPPQTCHDLYYGLLNRYLVNPCEKEFNKIKLLGYMHMIRWFKLNEPDQVEYFEYEKEQFNKLIGSVDNLLIEVR